MNASAVSHAPSTGPSAERSSRAAGAPPQGGRSGGSRRAGPGRPAAYSLVELVMVMAIMAIAAAIAAPRYAETLTRYRVDAAARRIVADLLQARAVARASGAPVSITFKPELSAYEVDGVVHPDRRSGTYRVVLGLNPYEAVLESADLGGDAALSFDAFGMPDSGGDVVVRVGVYTQTVTVNPGTGMASVGAIAMGGPP